MLFNNEIIFKVVYYWFKEDVLEKEMEVEK